MAQNELDIPECTLVLGKKKELSIVKNRANCNAWQFDWGNVLALEYFSAVIGPQEDRHRRERPSW